MSNEPENKNWDGEDNIQQDFYEDIDEMQDNETEDDLTEEEYIKAQAYSDEIAGTAGAAATKSNWLKELYEWTQAIAVAVVLALLINQFLFAIVQVEGSSMVPTLHDKERLVVTKLLYKPKQHDIVIIKSDVLKKHIVKRVIALPGQEVNIDSKTGDVYVDGVLQEEPYIKEKINPARIGTKYAYPFVIPEDTVFVMGDNRNNSQDSRSIGVIPYSEIVGKASLRIMPFHKFGGLYHELKEDAGKQQE